MKTILLHVSGMHCSACPILIEEELKELQEVVSVKASLRNHCVEINGDFGEKEIGDIVCYLTEKVRKHGYVLSEEKQRRAIQWADFSFAIPFAMLFIGLFFVLQKIGVLNLVTTANVNYGTAFIVGLIASVSSCMAVVGGLVLSLSANFAKGGDKVRPQLFFHGGRLISFFVLGGVIGALGSVFQLGITGMFVMSFLAAIVLIVLGINLLDIFLWTKRIQLSLPHFIGNHIDRLKRINHTLMPFLVGAVTFFLPCGFTQSMQIYTLTTGDFWTGAFTMSVFALGTLPVLALLSFSSLSIHTKVRSGIFFKTAGLVVIFFGLFNLINSLVAVGFIPSLFNFS